MSTMAATINFTKLTLTTVGVTVLVIAATEFFRPASFNKAPSLEATVMSDEDIMKSAASLSFRKELSNAAFDNLMSEERKAGSQEGKKVDFDAFKKEHILPWSAFGGVTSKWLYMDQNSNELATAEGRKKRYDYWTGYATAIGNMAPEGVKVTAHPCHTDVCPILVEWPDPNMSD